MAHFDDTKLKAYFRAELTVLYSLCTLFFAVTVVTGWESVEAVEGIALVLVFFGTAWLGLSVWCVVGGAEKMVETVKTPARVEKTGSIR